MMTTSRVRSQSVGEDDAYKGRRGDATSGRHWGWQLLLSCSLVGGAIASSTVSSNAQIVPDATLGHESSQVKSPIPGSFQIDGGATRGTNLFHSFREFSIPTGGSASFNNAPSIQNILTRVTGSSVSNIDGLIRANGKANLFFLNPNGIIFGPHAQLDIGGSFVASTASRLKFANGSEFSAINPQAPPLLTVNLTPGVQWEASQPGATITNTGNLAVGQDLAIIADKLDLQGQLQAGRDLTLLAQDTVRVRDTVATPFLAQAGGNLTIQGNQGIDILALNHPTSTPFVSGGNLSLISDGIISGDAHFASGGNFSIKSVSGGLAHFKSEYDPIISSTGDVDVAADYEGASLLVESKGNIRFQGSINITGPDTIGLPTGPDTATLSTSSALILRSGQSALAYGGVNFGAVPASGTGSVPPGITLGGDVTLQPFNGAGGMVSLLAASGDVNTQRITTNGGAININSAGSINSNEQDLNTMNSGNNGGAISLFANGDITTGDLRSESISGGNGGAITLVTTNGSINIYESISSSFSYPGLGRNGGTISLIANSDITTGDLTSDSTSIGGSGGNGGAITLVTTNGSIKTGDLISTSGNSGGNGGTIHFVATNGSIAAGDLRSGSYSNSHSMGDSGVISLIAKGDIVVGNLSSESLTDSGQNGGAISLLSTNGNIATGDVLSSSYSKFGTAGNGGAISLNATNGSITTGELFSGSYADSGTAGNGGAISLVASGPIKLLKFVFDYINPDRFSRVPGGTINSTGVLGSGNITIISNSPFALANSIISSDSFGSGKGGDIQITAPSIFFTNGTQISASTHSSGLGGNITLFASDRVELSGAVANAPEGVFAPQAGVASIPPGTFLGGFIPTGNIPPVVNGLPELPPGTLFPSGLFTQTTVGSTGNAGQLRIETGRLIVRDGAAIATTTFGQGSNAGSISVQAKDSISVDNGSILSGVAGGAKGNSGYIDLQTGSFSVTAGGIVQTQTLGEGKAGAIQVNATDAVNLSGNGSGLRSSSGGSNILLGTTGSKIGQGGDISVTTNKLSIADGAVLDARTQSNSKGGNITVNANTLSAVSGGQLLTTTSATGQAGDITANVKEVELSGSSSGLSAQTTNAGQAGNLTLQPLGNEQSLTVNFQDGAQISAATSGSGKGGTVTVTGPESITISGNGTLAATSDAASGGRAGDVLLNTQQLTIASLAMVSAATNSTNPSAIGGNLTVQASQVNLTGGSNLFAGTTGAAQGGNLKIQPLDNGQTLRVNFQDGATASASTSGSGKGGTLEITAPESITLSGNGSLLSAETSGSGTGGDLTLGTRTLIVRDGAQVRAGTSGVGNGGNLTVNASDSVQLSGAGSGLFVNATAGSTAGNLKVTTRQMSVFDGAQVTVSSPSGQAGNLTIQANSLHLNRGTLLAETGKSSPEGGANITLSGLDLLRLDNESLISANAFNQANGGNIKINSTFVVATSPTGSHGSDITANAGRGNGGAVNITTQGLFGIQFRPKLTPNNDITVSSDFGLNGTFQLNTPGIDPSRGLASLPIDLVDASRRIVQNCGAGAASQRNSFVITGRGGLPVNPREALSRDAVHVDWVTLNPPAENRTSSAIVVPEKSATPAPLVEAQGWVINNQGQVVLVAQSPTLTPHSSWHKPSDCGVQKSVSSF